MFDETKFWQQIQKKSSIYCFTTVVRINEFCDSLLISFVQNLTWIHIFHIPLVYGMNFLPKLVLFTWHWAAKFVNICTCWDQNFVKYISAIGFKLVKQWFFMYSKEAIYMSKEFNFLFSFMKYLMSICQTCKSLCQCNYTMVVTLGPWPGVTIIATTIVSKMSSHLHQGTT